MLTSVQKKTHELLLGQLQYRSLKKMNHFKVINEHEINHLSFHLKLKKKSSEKYK